MSDSYRDNHFALPYGCHSSDHGLLTMKHEYTDDGLLRPDGFEDSVGATPMDRPEWIAVHPRTKEVYGTVTNNVKRALPVQPCPLLQTRGPTMCLGTSSLARTGRRQW
jgi:secreted PhoX family phosphatase